MIKTAMCFINVYDFYTRRKLIKHLYEKLSTDEKAIYKYYVYSRRLIREKVCDKIWDYLNACDEEQLLEYDNNLYEEYSKYI